MVPFVSTSSCNAFSHGCQVVRNEFRPSTVLHTRPPGFVNVCVYQMRSLPKNEANREGTSFVLLDPLLDTQIPVGSGVGGGRGVGVGGWVGGGGCVGVGGWACGGVGVWGWVCGGLQLQFLKLLVCVWVSWKPASGTSVECPVLLAS